MRSPALFPALWVGLVGGTLYGAIDGLRTVQANAFFNSPRYALFCFGAPLLLTTLACVIGVTAAGYLWTRTRRPLPSVGRLAAVLAGVVAVVAVQEWRVAFLGALQQVGATSSWATVVVLMCGGLLAAISVLAAAVTLQRVWDWLRSASARRAVALACVAANVLPLAAFTPTFFDEGKGVVYQGHRNAVRGDDERNVLLISLDTVRWDRVGAYRPGGLTPAIDRLARRGAVFERAISTSPWTLPAVASVLSGLLPSRHGAGWPTSGRDLLARTRMDQVDTVATVLQRQGFFTQAFVSNPYLSLPFGLGDGFHGYENLTLESEAAEALAPSVTARWLLRAFPRLVPHDDAETVTRRATTWLRRHHPEHFFLWLHYIDPHAPYADPAERRTSFRGDTLLHSHGAPRSSSLDIARMRAGEISLSGDEKAALVGLYEGEIAYLDAQIGMLLDTVDALDLARSTLVVVLADHGEEFWDHGGVEHGHTLFDELIVVPLVMAGPEVPAGVRVKPVVSLVDVAPTILELAGAEPLRGIDGVSLVPALHGRAPAGRVVAAESLLFGEERRGIRTEKEKYIRWSDGREELYDLTVDDREVRNVADGVRAADVRERFARTFGDAPPRTGMAATPSPAARAALRALGYVQ